jgi:hypothetical protein
MGCASTTYGTPAPACSSPRASVKAVQAQLGHATASITLDTYGHLFPSEMDTLGDRLELVRDAAVVWLGRTQHGPTDDHLGETAGG